jgi:subtilisin family serine protease
LSNYCPAVDGYSHQLEKVCEKLHSRRDHMLNVSRLLFVFSFIHYSALAAYDPDVIPGRYIVNLGQNQVPEIVANSYRIKPKYIYRHAINGFSAALSQSVVDELLNDKRVTKIETDKVVRANETEEYAVTWGIDRVDQRSLPLDGLYKYDQDGADVTAYVIDSGIRYDHQEFGTRATFGYDAFGGTGADCNGHGTHVSGTIAGKNYGVAKNTKLKAVRVLDCNGSGSTSGVIAGIDWVIANRVFPAVANLSLGSSSISPALDTAVENLIKAGVATAVAAGNSNQDACSASPARVPTAMTIGATNRTDTRSSFSNYGSCVDWFAPGEVIESAWNTSATDVRALNGTSMASPHTAGAAALYLQHQPNATPLQVREALFTLATKGVVTGTNSINNHMLHTLITSTPPEDDSTPPTIALMQPKNGSRWRRMSTLTFQATASDNVKVTSVRFYVNNTVICTDTTAPYSCSWRMPLFASPSYQIVARAFDARGNVATSVTSTIRRN